jgi:hypothetical protein
MANNDDLTEVATKAYVKDMLGVVLEKIDHNNQLMMEAIMPKLDRIPKIEENIVVIKQDIDVIKGVLKITTKDVANHERRITRLEAKTA